MKGVIVEDEFLVADHLRKILVRQDVEVIDMVDNVESAVDLISRSPDFFLVDIRLSNNSNGISLGEKLNKHRIPFIYITANNEIDVIKRAASTKPQTYITKPFNERDVIAAVEVIRGQYSSSVFFNVLTPKGKVEIPLNEILYFEADGSYTKIVTADQTYLKRVSLKEILDNVTIDFIRIHRSYIVNVQQITSRKANSVFIGETELNISRSYKKNLQD